MCWIEPRSDGSVVIPESVTSVPEVCLWYIADNVPSGCGPCMLFEACMTRPVSIDFGNSGISSISNHAFIGCSTLASVEFAHSNVTSIGNFSFAGCTALAGVGFAKSNVSSIGDHAFDGGAVFGGGNALTSLDFADTNVQSFGPFAFANSPALASVGFANSNIRSIADNAFENCTALTSVGFAGSLAHSIGNYAFYRCTALASVELADTGIHSIGHMAFKSCTALARVGFARFARFDRPGAIGYNAFYGCSALVSVTFAGSNIRSISNYSFGGCSALANVEFAGSSIVSVGYKAFADLPALASVGFANSDVRSIGRSAFYGCTNLASLDLSSSPWISSVNASAFGGCTSLVTITLPQTGISVDPSAFGDIGCRNLQHAVGTNTCLRECVPCPMNVVSVALRSNTPPADEPDDPDSRSCHRHQGRHRVSYAYRDSSNGAVFPAPDARPWVTIARRKWAIGRTYQFPPITTKTTNVNAANILCRLRAIPPGFFINPSDGSMLGVPPAKLRGQQFTATLSAYDSDDLRGAVVLSTFSLQYEYADVDDRSTAVGPHNRSCEHGGRRVEQQPGGNWSAEFDGRYSCECTLGFVGGNCENQVPDPRLTVISIAPGAAADHFAPLSDPGAGGAANYSYPAATGSTPRLSVARVFWAVGEAYRLPAIAVRGCPSASTAAVSEFVPCTDVVADAYRGINTFDLIPLPPGWFINTGTGSILGLYTGENGTTFESSITVSRPGVGPTVIGTIRFHFIFKDTDNRSTAVGPHGRPCWHGSRRTEQQSDANWSADFDGGYSCDCTQGFTGSNCEATLLASAPAPEPSLLPAIALGVVALALGAIYHAKRTMPRRNAKAARRRLRGIASGTASCVPNGDEAQLLLFTALSLGCDDLVAALLEHGADAKARHPETHQLPHSLALCREPPNTALITELFRAHCELDVNIGELLRQPATQALLEQTLLVLAREQWRSALDGATVLHKVVDACRLGQLEPSVATALASRLLQLEPSLLLAVDHRSRTPAALAAYCDGARELERLLTTVVFDRYQLLHAETHEYRSPTAVIYRCRDLDAAAGDDPAPAQVLKMMKHKASWVRELQSRSALAGSGAEAAVVAVASATCVCDALGFQELTLPDSVARLTRRCPTTVVHNARHRVAFELMSEYPFALCMPLAERNLLEIIQSERLAGLPIGVIGFTARKLAVAISRLHGAGVVHADIKPRNVVRTPGDVFKLIDFDMAFQFDGRAAGLPSVHAAASKIKASNAYATPELVRWSNGGAQATVPDNSAIRGLVHPVQVDLFSFGLTLFELVTGAPLLEHSYDSLTPRSLPTMLGWSASTPAFDERAQEQIGALHPGEDRTALINVLQWLLDDDASKRPASMAEVLSHSFFDASKGVMREHFLVEKIRQKLGGNWTGLAGPRPLRDLPRVLISYCWADTNFVLGKLAMALAGRVKSLWLDRLGGSDGMMDWPRLSMDRGVARADVVLAVVSPKYTQSKNCGFEMGLAHRHGKEVIPLILGLPFDDWKALKKIGNTELKSQFHDAATGDGKLFIDFGVPELFETKFHQELVPRLRATAAAAVPNTAPAAAASDSTTNDHADVLGPARKRSSSWNTPRSSATSL